MWRQQQPSAGAAAAGAYVVTATAQCQSPLYAPPASLPPAACAACPGAQRAAGLAPRRALEPNTACAGPVLEALKRFRQLQEFRIGNGADIDWGCPGAAGLMSKLVQLRLDFRQRPEWDGERNVVGGDIHTLPSGIANALSRRQPAACAAWHSASNGAQACQRCALHCPRWLTSSELQPGGLPAAVRPPLQLLCLAAGHGPWQAWALLCHCGTVSYALPLQAGPVLLLNGRCHLSSGDVGAAAAAAGRQAGHPCIPWD